MIPPPSERDFKQLYTAFSNQKGQLELENFRAAVRLVLQHVALNYRRVEQAQALKEFLKDETSFNQKVLEGFKKFDTNNDGNLDLKEATEAINFVYSLLKIDPLKSQEVQRIYRAVQNQQGKVGVNEFKSGLRYILQQFIANHKH